MTTSVAAETKAPRQRDTLADRWQWLGRLRERVSRLPGGRTTWRVFIGVLGALIIIGGAILLPLPGPGWVIIFVGLGVWATEFEWAGRLLTFAQRQVKRWTEWAKQQPRWLQIVGGLVGLIFLAGVAVGSFLLVRLITG